MSVGTCVARVSSDAVVGGGRGEVCQGGWASANPTSFTFGSQLQLTAGSSGSNGMRRGVRALRAQDIVDCGYVWVAQGGVKGRRVWNPPPSTCTTELMPGWGIPSAGVQPGGSCWRRQVHPISCPHLESSETNGLCCACCWCNCLWSTAPFGLLRDLPRRLYLFVLQQSCCCQGAELSVLDTTARIRGANGCCAHPMPSIPLAGVVLLSFFSFPQI